MRTDPEPPVVDHPLLFLDYDGTLAPIVDEPMQAFPHTDVPDLLVELERRYPVWIVTGRYVPDLNELLTLPLPVVGLHGLQRGVVRGEVRDVVPEAARQSIARLRADAPEADGVRIEEKGPTFAVHYRRAADKEAVRAVIRDWLSATPPELESVWGKDVVELRPKGINKGVAVREIAGQYPDRTPVYIGDDVTDEDAFAALGEDAVTVKVGKGETAARYRLADVEAVVAYLKRYLTSLLPSASAPPA